MVIKYDKLNDLQKDKTALMMRVLLKATIGMMVTLIMVMITMILAMNKVMQVSFTFCTYPSHKHSRWWGNL